MVLYVSKSEGVSTKGLGRFWGSSQPLTNEKKLYTIKFNNVCNVL